MKEKSKIKTYELWGFRIFTAWCITALIFLFRAKSTEENIYVIDSVRSINTFAFICIMLIVLAILSSVNSGLKKWYSDIVICCLTVPFYFCAMMYEKTDVYMCTILMLFIFIGLTYIFKRFGEQTDKFNISSMTSVTVIGMALLMFMLYVGGLSVVRCMNMKSPSYDFGIFSQMYYYMKETFMPLTTCERDTLLSHFNVHMSPVLYLLLPVYCIFPSPVTILVMQIIILGSAVIPLYLICRNRKLPNLITTCICVAFLFYPSYAGGVFYDFHENKFLAPLLLWFIYFMEKRKTIPATVFAVLTLMVKEDAAIYVACVALYYMINLPEKKEKIKSIIIFIVSCIYFLAIVGYLSRFGDGAMTGRFGNFLLDREDSIVSMIVNIIKNPAYFFSQLLNADKLQFILWTMVPLAFIPLLSRKLSNYILFLPYLLIHLISNYVYQHNIYFQYTYGTVALLFLMVILYFSEGEPGKTERKNKKMALIMVCGAIIMFVSAITVKNYYFAESKNNSDRYEQVREAFEKYIPEEASVEASSFYVTPLSERKYVYHLGSKNLCDYVVYDLRISSDQEKIDEEYQPEKEALGYTVIYEMEGYVRILKSPSVK